MIDYDEAGSMEKKKREKEPEEDPFAKEATPTDTKSLLRNLSVSMLDGLKGVKITSVEFILKEGEIEEATFSPSLGITLSAMTKTSSGLYYQDVVAGTGVTAVSGNTVTVNANQAGTTTAYDFLTNLLTGIVTTFVVLLLGIQSIYLHIARAQDWEAEGLAFPGHFLIRVGIDGGRHVVDPFNDGVVREASDLRELLRKFLAERGFPVAALRLFASARSAGKRRAWQDGEIVVEDPAGVPSFGLLQADLSQGRTDRFRYIVFDLLYCEGFDLTKATLVDRSWHVVIESAHPSPLSAHNGFFGSRPFSRTNAALVEAGLEPIDWAIPPLQ